ncbi:GNAT family N-acetyltransferase [Glaciecola sp. SC05]|uniref:GNAT family N-acetyltransferase n=1 Tax=Glaciecola sp. SC05 TaxID=1987355 RepID=UPI0035292558
MQHQWQWSIVTDLQDIPSESQHALVQQSDTNTPFLSVAFLKLLAQSHSVDGDTGWQSHHILVTQTSTESSIEKPELSQDIVALLPCYLKSHSYGEYVFDHAWASAYHQHQLAYYPKLLCAVPFTPVTGSRALIHRKHAELGVTEQHIFDYVGTIKEQLTERADASSLHVLFLPRNISDALLSQNMHQRLSIQFVWYNQEYSSMDDFMQALTSRKRRSIRKERAPFAAKDANDNGVSIKTLSNDALSQDVVDAFYLCYQQTYYKRSGHAGYLSGAFFDQLLNTMKDNICIVAAFRDQRMIAGSLFFYNDTALFGRYWGALEDVSGLHFECCYYRGIEFAIAKGIQVFNPGTQGEHKILRGFRPTFCYSNHYLVEPAFDRAVADFVIRERAGIKQYHAETTQLLPFKQEDS